MSSVTDKCKAREGRAVVICDFSPPRSADPGFAEQAQILSADFICVAYSPGKSVRMDSAMAAFLVMQQASKDVIFNLAVRDMNKLALQNHLLGAFALGLENVVILRGDDFSERELTIVKDVNDFKPSDLIGALQAMNQGLDFKGQRLRSPTRFCVGASVDLSRGIAAEARLVHRKAAAGADFFITQPVHDLGTVEAFVEGYRRSAGEELSRPTFYGVQILDRDGVSFGHTPEAVQRDLEKGRSGEDIAIELLYALGSGGIETIYLIPPILRGGVRNYEAAQRVLQRWRH